MSSENYRRSGMQLLSVGQMDSYWILILRVAILLAGLQAPGPAADWPTSRGTAARTGSIDGLPGPQSAKVIWVHKSTDQYVAAPVPVDETLLVSSLAAFNTSSFQALTVNPTATTRTKWSKSVPYLKLPTVCAPAVAGNLVVFGDGMHQTDGAILHGVRLDSGLPLWQYPVPGQLVHLEGTPTLVNGRVIVGGGNAGVLCLDPTRLELDGKEFDPATIQKVLESRWHVLLATYEKEKLTDPDFAIAPSEDSLPKARPKLLWQQGVGQWHVDAAVNVFKDQVLVASAFLDAEKVGERALISLKLADGQENWRIPLSLNPWAGATVAGDLAIIGCSSIRLEPRDVPGAQGEVVVVSLIDGRLKWKKPLPAGIVSAIAIKDGLAVFTATDGCVRAWDVDSGQERWKTDPSAAYFASPAIADSVVYTADLKGKVRALNLKDGRLIWSLDLGKDPAIKAPGMVYGGPVVAAGKVYVATCNLDSASKLPTAVVCIGEK